MIDEYGDMHKSFSSGEKLVLFRFYADVIQMLFSDLNLGTMLLEGRSD